MLLALVSRPDAGVVIVDDIDQLRSVELREEILADMRTLSQRIPVVVNTVNDFDHGLADDVVDLRPDADGSRSSQSFSSDQRASLDSSNGGSTLWIPEEAEQ